MNENYEMILCVVNAGFSDEVMDAAREAGARGGTVMHARGTANKEAEAFYKAHGVEEVEPAFEWQLRQGVPLMFTKHCLRYSMGWCPKRQKGKSPFKEPYFLQYKETTLRLQFDCANCQMLIYQNNTKK